MHRVRSENHPDLSTANPFPRRILLHHTCSCACFSCTYLPLLSRLHCSLSYPTPQNPRCVDASSKDIHTLVQPIRPQGDFCRITYVAAHIAQVYLPVSHLDPDVPYPSAHTHKYPSLCMSFCKHCSPSNCRILSEPRCITAIHVPKVRRFSLAQVSPPAPSRTSHATKASPALLYSAGMCTPGESHRPYRNEHLREYWLVRAARAGCLKCVQHFLIDEK